MSKWAGCKLIETTGDRDKSKSRSTFKIKLSKSAPEVYRSNRWQLLIIHPAPSQVCFTLKSLVQGRPKKTCVQVDICQLPTDCSLCVSSACPLLPSACPLSPGIHSNDDLRYLKHSRHNFCITCLIFPIERKIKKGETEALPGKQLFIEVGESCLNTQLISFSLAVGSTIDP